MRKITVLVLLLTGALIFLTCGNDSTGPSIVFEPGMSFVGTYQVQPDPYTPPGVDTMLFESS